MNESRRLFLLGIVSFLVSVSVPPCFSTVYSGVVVDGSNGGTGVPGVLVAAGYGLCRTVSDSAGHFTLDVDESGVRQGTVRRMAPVFTVRWNMRQRFLDLTDAPGITPLAVYRPDGSRVWNTTPAAVGKHRILTTPSMAPGVYLMTFILRDNSRFTWRSVQGIGAMTSRIALPLHDPVSRTAAAESSQAVKLIFRNDNY
ncbi:MAG: hypothetical protein JW863_21330, partial [Chitinispirillaceae bacterium]|nr:hypothetical protein [Chitinispirillaceae bacterium]